MTAGEWPAEAEIRAAYDRDPALTPFSRKPVPFEDARKAGINSYMRAERTAREAKK